MLESLDFPLGIITHYTLESHYNELKFTMAIFSLEWGFPRISLEPSDIVYIILLMIVKYFGGDN